MKNLFFPVTFILLFLCSTLTAQQVETYRNPVIAGDFPDPTVIRVGDTYYAASSSSEWVLPYRLYESKDLVNWEYIGPLFNEMPDWTIGSYWAPELYYHNSTYYVYYTARRKSDKRSYIGVASTKDLKKGFTDHGLIIEWTTEAIDAYVIDIDDKSYITWKAYGLDKRPIEILGAELSADKLKVTGEVFSLVAADTDTWEAGGLEGQCLVKHNDYIYMFYAGNSCCGRECNYQTGVARAKSIQGPWEKYSGNPLLYGDNNWRCPGHGTLVETADKRFFYLYHAYNAQSNVYIGRQGLLDEVIWNKTSGWPEFRYGRTPSLQAEVPLSGTIQRSLPNFSDDFTSSTLRKEWIWDASKPTPKTNLLDGRLLLQADGSLTGSFLGLQAKAANYTLKATVMPNNLTAKGICIYGSANECIGLSVGGNKVELWQVKQGVYTILASERISGEKCILHLTTRFGQYCQFGWTVVDNDNKPTADKKTIIVSVGKTANRNVSIPDQIMHITTLPQWDRPPQVGLQVRGVGYGTFEDVSLNWE